MKVTKYASGLALVLVLFISSVVARAQNNQPTLPSATVGTGYAAQLSLDGMELATPIQVTVSGLPDGLSFDTNTRTISGVPTGTVKDYAVHIVITDANTKKVTADAKLTLNEAKPVEISPGAELDLPDATENQQYKVALHLPAGATAAAASSLPSGISLADSNISGKPAGNHADGTYSGAITFTQDGVAKTSGLKIRLHLTPLAVKIAAVAPQ